MLKLLAALGSVAVGCYDPNPAQECGAGMACDAAPQVDAKVNALPDGCAATTCSNNVLLTCGQMQVCELGCASSGAARCNDVLPSNNVSDWDLADATLPLNVTTVLNFDTELGTIRDVSNGLIVRPPGTGVRNGIYFGTIAQVGSASSVFVVGDLAVQRDGALQFVGDNPVVLLVNGSALIDGRVTASADTRGPFVPGAGGGVGGQDHGVNGTGCGGGKAAESVDYFDGGGGGAGFREAGGKGGVGGVEASTGGIPGSACSSSDLQPLIAGSGGGAGAGFSQADSAGLGGGGGGALQLSVRYEIRISSTGSISANGGGGGAGRSSNGTGGGGGGGGSGGGLLIEAPTIRIDGGIFANGGGGGGAASSATPGFPGSAGTLNSVAATGGMPGVAGDAGAGGAGGSIGVAEAGMTGASNGGGGGGAAGRIVIRTFHVISIAGEISPQPAQLPLQLQ